MKDPETKKFLIELLEKNPIIEFACKKAGISRMTLYRWLKADKEFKKQVDEATGCSRDTLNDVGESQIISSMKNGNIGATKFWLTHNSPIYKKKAEIIKKQLDPVSEKIIEQYLWHSHPKQYGERKPPEN